MKIPGKYTGPKFLSKSLKVAKKGTEIHELLQAGTDGYQRVWQNVEENSSLGRWYGPSKGGKNLED